MKYAIKEIIYYIVVRLPYIILGKFIRKNLIHAHWGRGLHNFGDCLSPDILKFYGLTPVYVPNMLRADIILAGSILQWLPYSYKGYIVGTGGDSQRYSFPNAKILAVRGKLTLTNLSLPNASCIKLGDPGLLMAYVYPQQIKAQYKLGIIPHFVDANENYVKSWKRKFGSEVLFIDVLQSPHKVIQQIKQCQHIISSSLHGLIIADAFHIPNMRIVNRKTMPTAFYDYKFDDYYSSLNCESAFIEVTGNENLTFLIESTTLKPIDMIENIKNNLHKIMLEVSDSFKHDKS